MAAGEVGEDSAVLGEADVGALANGEVAGGTYIAGRQVLVVEDVVTSGGQIVLSTADPRALGADVREALCVIDREQGGAEALGAEGIELLSLLTGLRPECRRLTWSKDRSSWAL